MNLVKAKIEDVYKIISIQTDCFIEFIDRYQDTFNPTNESAFSIREYITNNNSDIYFIQHEDKDIGVMKIEKIEEGTYRIDDFGILPTYRDQHLGTQAMLSLFKLYEDVHTWRLATMLEEKRNLHFYEKLGFKRMEDIIPISITATMTMIEYELKK